MKLEEALKKIKGMAKAQEVAEHPAAVLLPLVEESGEVSVLFEVRAKTLRYQPGEICFPGGRVEPGESPEECALRELSEELGITDGVILRPLDTLRHSSGQLIYPYLGFLPALEGLRIQQAEVEEVFTVPLSWFVDTPPKWVRYALAPDMENAPEELRAFLPGYRRERKTPVWVWEDHVIWGMTARVMVGFLEKYREV